jgi:hypothetical protein
MMTNVKSSSTVQHSIVTSFVNELQETSAQRNELFDGWLIFIYYLALIFGSVDGKVACKL